MGVAVTVLYSGLGYGVHFTGNYTFDTGWIDHDPSNEGLYSSGTGYPYVLNFNWYDPHGAFPGGSYSMYAPELDPVPAPEPATFALLAGGLMLLAAWRRLELKN